MLISTGGFYPGFKFGGPVRSICNLVDYLNDEFNFSIVTSDRDLSDTQPYECISIDEWSNSYKGNEVYYSSPGLISFIKYIYSVLGKTFDVVYLNSFFSFKFTISLIILYRLKLISCDKLILAPRGELTCGAMSLKSWKKKTFLYVFHALGLGSRVTYQFTSSQEKAESLNYLGTCKHILVPNMHANMPVHQDKNKGEDELNIIYLSRISRKKNLHIIIEALQHVRGRIRFTIAGVVDDSEYWDECQAKLVFLSKNVDVRILGPVDREQVAEELTNSHVFVLPTLNENYGHAIVEAMMFSNVVLLSDQTPWNAVSSCGGFVVSANDVKGYADVINKVVRMRGDEFNNLTLSIHHYCKNSLFLNELKIREMFE
ncbi:glycosyltransferase family 4 protein [Vibrio alfacsensis]|uniref:glycosyltransferase family 4 protein n=1 Tax=Vibrio alfacsensis TaxID=1074311 RepID=UPI0040686D4D